MSPELRFSVVIPLYNKASHIRRTLQSCLAQALAPFEIIVIDDGSTDDGYAIVQSVDDPRVKPLRQPNGGVAHARNTGIARAQGDWVVFLDADDWQHPRFLQGLAELIKTFPEADMVATRYVSIPEDRLASLDSTPVGRVAPDELIADLPKRWQQGATFFTSSVAVRRTRLQGMQPCFPPRESYGEDMDLWFRLAELGPIALHGAPLIARVWTADGLSVLQATRTEPPFLLRMEARALQKRMRPALAASTLKFVDHQRISLARDALSVGQRRHAAKLLWRARRHSLSTRWLLTVAMGALLPGTWVYGWQRWRKRRKMVLA